MDEQEFDRAIEIVAKNLGKGIVEIEKKLLKAFKKHHGIEDLYFYGDHSWFYCRDDYESWKTLWPKRNEMDMSEILRRLSSLASDSKFGGYVVYDQQRFRRIDDLKRYYLTKKLSGI